MATILSLEDREGLRCIDVVEAGGSYGFKEFRRDPEDGGRWSIVADYSDRRYDSREDALAAAARAVGWLAWPDPDAADPGGRATGGTGTP